MVRKGEMMSKGDNHEIGYEKINIKNPHLQTGVANVLKSGLIIAVCFKTSPEFQSYSASHSAV